MKSNVEEIIGKIKYEIEKLRVAYYRAGESSSQLSDESNLGVCLTVLRHHKNQAIIAMEKLEDDLIEQIQKTTE
ncbi:hypothetical protein CON15_19455 [Bacillus cereus]|uniref:Uncharacterized protein n=1 Tax=Bacillus thuringiensis TaxID=1428 RepID=A0A9X6U4S3_BACTU|nr:MULTISPECIES: hypothetical protein [Bacillus cereus group]MEB9469495.1 hypothetical protein [Bacillus cereus]MRA82296.1 hypothetical protein [Bacillus thuringiensis]OUA18971.1 hypothetical protein BK776_28035 [Bacillus thuringiensis serovar aizawai]PDZ55719.1 hypothetical protein CON15_19455 [Bacillus cereus]PED16387.1 hypothetical protein CON01_00625 [Bacillus thuringiensis]